MSRNRPVGQIVLLLLSLVGAGIAIYLTTVHYAHVPLVCSTQGFVDCAAVLASSYSVVPGTSIPITIPGLLWCLVSAALAIIALRAVSVPRNILIAQCAWALVGLLTALYLVFVEIVRLHTICAWCTALHVLILIIFLITLVQLQQGTSDEEMDLKSERG
ncbi:MAG TPA: vitamin K epoxide reductase family protein [Ktedonobacteraceae bacterium]|nr:vitamin K epoxide reductase family protein [Ktedonobacteraceae bacterium]